MNNCFDCSLNNRQPVRIINVCNRLDYTCGTCKTLYSLDAWEKHQMLYTIQTALSYSCVETLTKESVKKLYYVFLDHRRALKEIEELVKNGFLNRPKEGQDGVIESIIGKRLDK